MPWRQPPPRNRVELIARMVLMMAPPVIVAAVGIAVAISPPPSVAGVERVPLYVWAAILIVGGLLTLRGYCGRLARSTVSGQALIAAGAGFYALHLLTQPDGLAAAGMIGASALGSLGDVFRHRDLARWRRAERSRAAFRHPSGD